MPTCDSCRKNVKGRLNTTVTGREICDPCNDRLLGAAAGIIAAGPDASTSEQAAAALSTAGWFGWLRARRRGGGQA